MLRDHIKQDISLAFQTGGCLLLDESIAESSCIMLHESSVESYFHSAIGNHLSIASLCHLNGRLLTTGLTVLQVSV